MPSSSREPTRVQVHAPGTVGNFGPGFDATSLAVTGIGDTLTLSLAEADTLTVTGPGADTVPSTWEENLVGPVLDTLRERTGIEQPLHVALTKPRAAGSGMGSSASSAGGIAIAFHRLFPEAGLPPEALVQAAGQAEGGPEEPHYDDVAAVVQGGLSIVRPGPDGLVLHRVAPPEDLSLAFLVPSLQLDTARMRALLPTQVPLSDASANLGAVAALIDAFHRGDVAGIGAALEDRLAVPARTKELAFYEPTRQAALEAGAHGATLSGSGPAIVAVCSAPATAAAVAGAMHEAAQGLGLEAEALTADPVHEVPYDAGLR